MKSLKLHFESLLDDDDIFLDPMNDKKQVEEWIKHNYILYGKLTISDDFVVDCSDVVKVKNKTITSLTNGLFRWGKVNRSFSCVGCENLKTLEGAPEEVVGGFYCNGCNNLTSLQGAPKKVGSDFWCDHCGGLETLEGTPKKIGGSFDCSNCENLKSLKGAPRKCRDFYCMDCKNLKTLEGAPEEVGGDFKCSNCNNLKITDSDRKKYRIME